MANQLVKRRIFDEVFRHLVEREEVTVILGARQTGKTTLLNQLRDELIRTGAADKAEILMFNLDVASHLLVFSSQTDFIEFLRNELAGKQRLFVFIDEFQRLKDGGRFIKGIYDMRMPVKFVLTGSSALELKSSVVEALTGRKRVFKLYPFDFEEFLTANEPELVQLLSLSYIDKFHKDRLDRQFHKFLVFGGFPKVAVEKDMNEKRTHLAEIFTSYMEKDIIGFIGVGEPVRFTKFFRYVASISANLLKTSELSGQLGYPYKTVQRYIEILQATFMGFTLRPFFKNTRREISKMPKIFLVDNGLRNYALENLRDFQNRHDRGQLLEQFVFTELLKTWDGSIRYWRAKGGAEVDFVLSDFYGNIYPIEVKSAYLSKPKLTRGIRSFVEKYHPKFAVVVNWELETEISLNSTDCKFILPYRIGKLTKILGM